MALFKSLIHPSQQQDYVMLWIMQPGHCQTSLTIDIIVELASITKIICHIQKNEGVYPTAIFRL